jgi:hypothetical protein
MGGLVCFDNGSLVLSESLKPRSGAPQEALSLFEEAIQIEDNSS